MNDILFQLENELKMLFDGESSGHDFYHLKRTLNISLTIQKHEGGDELIIAVSAILHDIHRLIQKQTGKFCSPKESLPQVKQMLDKTILSDEQKSRISHCIEFHEEYSFTEQGKTAYDIETMILQDADNLDAIGAIGIARTFAYGGANNSLLYTPEIPIETSNYQESENDASVIHHFYRKLLNLKDNMNTSTARKMAEERHNFMQAFLYEFFDEWYGKK